MLRLLIIGNDGEGVREKPAEKWRLVQATAVAVNCRSEAGRKKALVVGRASAKNEWCF